MTLGRTDDRSESGSSAQARFAPVFAHLGLITAYARRRGAGDPEALAAEVMTIAWRRLANVPADDPRPWLIVTARNLLLAERRRNRRTGPALPEVEATVEDGFPLLDLDPDLDAALRKLSSAEREAVLLVAWEDLDATAAAKALGISSAAFRVRLHRARRRLRVELGRRDHCAPHLNEPLGEA